MEYLAMYDIADPKRLRKVERVLKSYGVRVQKSVFECTLNDRFRNLMIDSVKNCMDEGCDSFRVYPLLNDSRIKQIIVGKGDFVQFKQQYLI